MSQTLVQRPTPVHELSSREIIDVDDLFVNSGRNIGDDDDVQFIMHRPSRLEHEPIVIGDSDDDVEIVAGPSRPAPPANRRPERNPQIRRPNRRMLFSPSPPPQDNYIPPVPPLPPFARAQPPLRLRPPDIPGLVRPLEQPFAFEQGLHAQAPPRAPSLHHGPREQAAGEGAGAARRLNMSFGGALVAFNRRNQFEPAHPAPPPAPNPARSEQLNGWRNILSNFGLGAYRMFFRGPEGSPDPMPRDADEDRDLLEALALAEDRQGERFRLYQWPNMHRRAHHQPPREEPDYKPSFTHPVKPEAGFSNDFVSQEIITISDEPGPSSGVEAGTVLVCAMCLGPLVINFVGPEEESRKRKLFALRCGHILDGKCIDAIMKPPAAPIQDSDESHETETVALSDKRKGKLKAEIPADLAEGEEANDMVQPNGPSRRNTGKQKSVKLEDEGSSVLGIPAKRKAAVSEPSEATDYVRSRLRPRRGESAIPPTITSPSLLDSILPQVGMLPLDEAVSPDPQRRQSGRGRRRRVGGGKGRPRGKGKGKASVPVVEAVFEWNCPVSTCGHKHKSVCIEGVWKMDGEQGAIAMYV